MFLNALGRVFVVIGRWARQAFGYAESKGLTDDLVTTALGFVEQAQQQFTDNAQRREWVVAALLALKVPESVARLAVELAVQLMKARASA